MNDMTIGQAADASGVKVTTIRFYEGRGLLRKPVRTVSGRRLYAPSDIARLRFIRHARDLGFDLDAITTLLDMTDDPEQDCAAADSMARQQRAAVQQRIALLQGLETELTRMIDACDGGCVSDCRVIESLADHAHCESHHGHAPL